MPGSEIGAVAGEHVDPLLARMRQVGGDEMRDVAGASASHPDVGRRGAGVLPHHHVCGGDGVALDAVRGGGVGELNMAPHVVRGQYPLPGVAAGDRQPAVPVDPCDGPGVPVGDIEVAVVAPRRDPVTDTDALSGAGAGRVASRRPGPSRRAGRGSRRCSAPAWSRVSTTIATGSPAVYRTAAVSASAA